MPLRTAKAKHGKPDSALQLQRHEALLLKAGAFQHAILSSPRFSIIATDDKGLIQLFNPGAEGLLGYAASELVGQIAASDLHDPQDLAARARVLSREFATPIAADFAAMAFRASQGIEDVYEMNVIRKDGSRFPAVVSITALRDDYDDLIGYLLIGTDNSVRKRVETELLDAMAAADKANHAKSAFLSSMSHELRTPLNAILGFAQLMQSGSPQPTTVQQRSIDQILKAGWYLLELINEILDLALVESGKLTLSTEPVSLSEVIEECKVMIEGQAQMRGISLRFPSADIGHYVKVDRTRLKQVLINLLNNAIKYNRPSGSVVVDCIVTRPGRIRICIEDSGEGLCEQDLAQLFQPFNRLGREMTDEEGTGIGLVTAKRLIEVMDGTIGVESAVGKGSVFWVELAITSERQHLVEDTHNEAGACQKQAVGHKSQTVLYIEDNPANMLLVEELVSRRPDLCFLSATDASRGIEMAREFLPDMILMDINLPGISGIQALKILREDPVTAHIPVVALSGNAIPRDIRKGLEAGFFRYLTKPINVHDFFATVDATLEFVRAKSPAAEVQSSRK